MKKKILSILLTGVVSSTAIAADSSVSVYGIIDQAMRSTDLDSGTKSTAMISGSYNTSRLGVTGTEDLGGGLTASFVLEGKLDSTSGNAGDGTNLFSRESSVSLSSKDLGTVTMGRTDTSDAEGLDTLAGIGNFGNFSLISGAEYSGDRQNTIRYTSPSIGGVTAEVGKSYNDGTNADTTSGSAVYKGSSFSVGVGMDKQGDDSYKGIGANINLGIASVGAMYGKRDAATDVTVSAFSAKVPLGNGFNAHGVYKTNEPQSSDKVVTAAVGLTKELSKRTMIHAVYQDTDKGTAAGSFYQVGLLHKF
jgi:predicted porin